MDGTMIDDLQRQVNQWLRNRTRATARETTGAGFPSQKHVAGNRGTKAVGALYIIGGLAGGAFDNIYGLGLEELAVRV